MPRTLSVLALAASLSCTTFAAKPAPTSPRSIQAFDTDWRFSQSDPADLEAKSPAFIDRQWQTVTLPHDWAISGPVSQTAPSGPAGGFFPTGVAWYRKTLDLPKLDPTRRTYIVFDGVMANSDVYCNGAFLGHHPYGYTSFYYDLTPHLHAGINFIAVRADNSRQPASRWYPGAGINRHVRVVTTAAVHIAPWGTFVTTPKVSGDQATIHIRATAANDSDSPATITLSADLTSPSGTHSLIAASRPATLAPHTTQDLDVETTLPHPDRWDLDHPALYTATATLQANNKPIDDEQVPFGIREFHFDPNQGFFLNGTHHKIYGAALHTDVGALGTAVPLAAWARRLTALRALGVNAIRTAHNPPAPEFLDLCDRMGFLVMDEMFDAWTVAKNPYDYHLYFKEWSLRDTADTVRRDRNHPSIILYSAGNEIHDTPHPDIAIPILKSLVDTFHQYDPTRPVTQALFRPNVSHDYDNGLADLLDVIGQNYRENEILKAHADKPTRSIVGTENTHDRNQWVAMRDHAEYSGQFLWTGIDYLGEAGKWPAIGSGSGLLLTTSLPRARAYERQSWWSETPMVRIARRVAITQKSPTDPGYEAPNAPAPTRFTQPLVLDWTPANSSPHTENIEVYTNAEEVELLLNETSLGTQKLHPDATPITFQVPYAPGVLKAVARTAGRVVAEDTLRTAGKPTRILLTTALNPLAPSPKDQTLTPDWNDITYVSATLVDAAGTPVPDTTTVVHFTTAGPATILATDNGNLLDHEPFQSPDHAVYNGTALALLRATAPIGTITITASAPGVPPATLTLKATTAKQPTSQHSF
ncbi:glycoside hydrolase family 2 TIM barrel-domain containing protein [Granulicella sp. dw_53]|uniref:glycoside hydrolase family 2 TIM barrel-domain containing protein n=1 Tax=Granulicella sp. dw_53 TaxID=2719792 RepID=UPI001BD69813|nr:glycoside hydrolase family 2 TIM barrel-domain containing protein [Granulicella sp. dw_53]